MLSALVSGLVSADMLMIFTDVNGLYDKILRKMRMQKYYFLPEVTEEISSLAGDAGSKLGTGGMKSKSIFAKTALSWCECIYRNRTWTGKVCRCFEG